MLLTKEVEVCWASGNKNHYVSLGYKFTKCKDKFIIPVEHLPKCSKVKVLVKCDWCGKEFEREYGWYLHYHNGGDACECCGKGQKPKKAWIEKYGVDNPMKNKNIQEKSANTFEKNHGVKYPFQMREVQDKIDETNIERFGVSRPFKSDEIQSKVKDTFQEKYGVDYLFGTEIFEGKMLELYGVKNAMQSQEIFYKACNTRIERGNMRSSKPERDLRDLLCDIYGESNVTWQKPLDRCILDCELIVNGIKIDVEYNGQRWHSIEKDKNRNIFVFSQGYKKLDVNGNHEIPTPEQIIYAINMLVNTDEIIATIDLDI